MNKDKTEIAVIVDRSGSMEDLAGAAIRGFNSFLQEQRALPGQARLSLILFDNEYLRITDRSPIEEVAPLNSETYLPRASTALYDAVGRTIDYIGIELASTPEAERPATVIIAILTDGLENASKEYTQADVAQMIQRQRDEYNWQFVFLGSDKGSLLEAKALNIPQDSVMAFAATEIGTQSAFNTMSETVTRMRKA